MTNDVNSEFDFSEHQLVLAPHNALTMQVPPLDNEDVKYREALRDYMISRMEEWHGIGLAANQINLNAAVFAMRLNTANELVINPAVHSVSKERALMIEGCLSEPELFLRVKRPTAVRCSWEDINGERVIHELTGWNARIFLHEYDHLQGVMFTDRVGRAKLDLARKKQIRGLEQLYPSRKV